MKDVYELLNDIDIDESEIEEMVVSDLEKEKVKANLRKVLKKNRKLNKGWKVAVAASFFIVGGILTIGITNPAYAAEIPVIGDIFRFLDGGRTGLHDKYKENANEINVTKECNGVAVTIKDAVFDGKTITYTYEIKSDEDLGKRPFLYGTPMINVEGYKGGEGGGTVTKEVGENTYVGQDNTVLEKEFDKINFKINISEIKGSIEDAADKSIKGEWNFDISLKAVEGKKKNVDKTTEKDGVKATIDSINENNMSFTINYSQEVSKEIRDKWFFRSLDLMIKDDLGNIYKNDGSYGHREENGNKTDWSATFPKLNDKATKLIITPKMELSNSGSESSLDKDGNAVSTELPIDENHPAHGEIVLDDIVIELEK